MLGEKREWQTTDALVLNSVNMLEGMSVGVGWVFDNVCIAAVQVSGL